MIQEEKTFPIQAEREADVVRPAGCVPWSVARLAYDAYAKKFGENQSLERIAERGGFGWTELVWLLRRGKDEEWDWVQRTKIARGGRRGLAMMRDDQSTGSLDGKSGDSTAVR